MAKKLNSVLGVDIGSRSIKIAEIRTQNKEPVVTAVGMIDTPEGAVDHTGIFNSDAVAASLKQAISEAGVSVSHVVVSLAGQASVLVRTLEVPRMNAAELREHMQWEISRNIPFAESNVVSDYKPLADEDPNSANMEVVMAIAPQSAIDTAVSSIKRAGRVPAAIDVEPLSAARSVVFSYGEEFQGETLCYVEMGHKTTAINIYRDGKLLMPRQIPIGSEMITRALADALNVPEDEAEKIKIEQCQVPASAGSGTFGDPFAVPGLPAASGTQTDEFQAYNPFADDPAPAYNPFADAPVAQPAPEPPAEPMGVAPVDTLEPAPEPLPEQTFVEPAPFVPAPIVDDNPEVTKLYGVIAPVVEEFIAEVRRSVDYFRSRGGDVSRIVLAGGGTKMPGLQEYVARSLGVGCEPYDAFRRMTINGKKVATGYIEDHRQEFALAIGNGLHIFFD